MISAVLITRNEAAGIARCLEALQPVVEEIIVVDSGSTDDTESICARFGVRFFSFGWQGYAANKNFGISQAEYPYILSIDADEVLSDKLQASILTEKKQLQGAYSLDRHNYFLGEWMRHAGWYPDQKVRLFPKDQAHWEGAFVHEKLVLEPDLKVSPLPGALNHYSIDSVSDHMERINRYSSLRAEALAAKGRSSSWTDLRLRPLGKFLKMYLLKGGWRAGWNGYILCRNSAHSVFLTYAKLKARQKVDQ